MKRGGRGVDEASAVVGVVGVVGAATEDASEPEASGSGFCGGALTVVG
jgi:hypothetical protein